MSFLLLFRPRLLLPPVAIIRRRKRTEKQEQSRKVVERKKERVEKRLAAGEERLAEQLRLPEPVIQSAIGTAALPAVLRGEDVSAVALALAGQSREALDLQTLANRLVVLIELERKRQELEDWLLFEELAVVLSLL